MSEIVVRDSVPSDVCSIAKLYGHYVKNGTATFEITPPDEAEVERRRQTVLTEGLPYLVAESYGAIAGYAYAALYRPRPAYRFTVEDSIYIHPSHLRKGIGRLLLAELIARCESGRWRQMVAIIGDSANAGSIATPSSVTLRSVRGSPTR